MILLPVTSSSEQRLSTIIDGVRYLFRVIFNTRIGAYSLSISTAQNAPMINGVVLVGGANLLGHVDIGISNLFAINVNDSNQDARFDNLGTDVVIAVLTEDEMADISA